MKRLFDMVGGLLGKRTHAYYMEQGANAVANDDLPLAEREYAKALELATEAKAHDDVAEISKQLANICVRSDKLAVAEGHYKRAYQTHEDSEQHEAAAEMLIAMGKLYYKQRRLPDAEQVLQYAMAVYQAQYGNNAAGIAVAASTLADCYLDKNQYAEAEKLLTRALEIEDARNQGEELNAAITRYKLGIAAGGQGKDAEAEAYFKKASEIFAKQQGLFDRKTAHEACACYHKFGEFYIQRGKKQQAQPLLKQAMQWAEAHPGYLDEADLVDKASL